MSQTNPTPPRLANWVLSRFLRNDLAEEVMGDLEEKFYLTAENKSPKDARINYWYQVFNYIRPFALKRRKKSKNSIYTTMIKQNLKISWRVMARQKLYAAIKIGGFSIGIASCILILLFISDELNYDKHYENGDRVYRILNVMNSPDKVEKWTAFQPPIKAVLETEYPEIETVGRLIPYDWFDGGNNQVRPEGFDKISYEEGFAYADPEILEILEIQMAEGSTTEALSKPRSIVISREKAQKYFPNTNPIGKTLILNEESEEPYFVGGVMEDFPPYSHLQYDFLITLTGEEFWPGEQTNWCCSNYNVYLRVQDDSNPGFLESKLGNITEKHMVPYFEEQGNKWADELKKHHSIQLQAVADIHLHSKEFDEKFGSGDIKVVWLFGIIAGIILLLATVNFVNLSTAKSANRAKEVGLRKVIGSQKGNLIMQFLTESTFYSALSFIVAFLLVILAIPFFNDLAAKTLIIPWNTWWFIPIVITAVLAIGLFSGLYPAAYLTAFKPIKVLKGEVSRGSGSSTFRNVLVVFQFTASLILIIGAVVVYKQMNYILQKDLGFEKEQVVLVHGTGSLKDKTATFKNQLLNIASVENVAFSNYLPVHNTKRDQNEFWELGQENILNGIGTQIWRVDEDYINTLGIKLKTGREFEQGRSQESRKIIINETMVKRLGKKDPIGLKITNKFQDPYEVIGIIEDFHFESMKGEIGSLALVLGTSASTGAIKINTTNPKETLQSIEAIWKDMVPNQSIRYSFLDDRFAAMYADVARTGKLLNIFSFLAILVACIGLFGLSGFMAEQRRKEISIRKVLGASLQSIFKLMASNFILLILISFTLAAPTGWYLMNEWLSDFKYQTEFGWEIIVGSGLVGIFISVLTISYESIRAGLQNPSKGLRAE